MPYWLYGTETTGGEIRYVQQASVRLAGGGLIQSAWTEKGSPEDVGWTVSAGEMLATGGWDPMTSAIVIDTAPRRDSVSLFRLLAVSGYTSSGWSPILLHLHELWWDHPTRRKLDAFKRDFKCDLEDGSYVRSILYLNANWNWGGNSRSTATLVTETAWDHFLRTSAKVSRHTTSYSLALRSRSERRPCPRLAGLERPRSDATSPRATVVCQAKVTERGFTRPLGA